MFGIFGSVHLALYISDILLRWYDFVDTVLTIWFGKVGSKYLVWYIWWSPQWNNLLQPNQQPPKKKKRTRKRSNVIWLNTPSQLYSDNQCCKKFLTLKDRCFLKGHPLNKAFNRQTVKASSSTTPIMAKIITGKNAKILDDNKEQEDPCNFQKSKTCPLEKKCQSKDIIYQAKVSQPNRNMQSLLIYCDFIHVCFIE